MRTPCSPPKDPKSNNFRFGKWRHAASLLKRTRSFLLNKNTLFQGKHHDGQLKTKIISILILQITMGMPWVGHFQIYFHFLVQIVQYFTLYTPYTTAWHYVFSIIIGSQGTMLCLIYLYKRRRISRRSTEERKRRGSQQVSHTFPTAEGDEMPSYQEYYLANPTI